MNYNQIAHLAVEAGRIILENGGETYRVEETMLRICKAYGIKESDSFVTPTGIILSMTDSLGHTTSIVKRIKKRTVNLEKVSRVNDLSRKLSSVQYDPDLISIQLQEIDMTKRYSTLITLLFGSLAAGSFTLLFGGNSQDFCTSFIIAAIIKYVTKILDDLYMNEFFINTLGGAIAALLALLSVHFNIASSIDKVTIGSIMLLVPGLAITNAIRDTLAGDLVAGITRAIEAFLIAIGIAVGTGIVTKIWLTLSGGNL